MFVFCKIAYLSYIAYHISEYSIIVKPTMKIKIRRIMCPVSCLHV